MWWVSFEITFANSKGGFFREEFLLKVKPTEFLFEVYRYNKSKL